MIRIGLLWLSILWGSLVVMILAVIGIGNIVPTKGTLLLTYNIFLDRHERFEIIDLNQQIHYSFSPDVPDGTLSASLAPGGRKIAIVSITNGQHSLSIIGAGGQTLIEPIATNYALDLDDAHWSGNGRYFLFYDALSSDNYIYILDTRSGNRTEIQTYENRNMPADWSADRQQIVYTDLYPGEIRSQIWITDISGENRQQLTDILNMPYCPAWSPDGETIAYVEALDEGEYLRYVTVEGDEDERYASGIWQITTCPVWSDNGRYMIFVALDLNSYQTEVILFDVLTGEETAILEVEQTVSLQLWR